MGMKNYFKILLLFTLPLIGYSQNKVESEFNKLYFCSYLPGDIQIPRESSEILISKMEQLVSNNGLGGSNDCNSRFYITCQVSLNSKEVTSTSPSSIIIKSTLTFSIRDYFDKVTYATYSKDITAVGVSEIKVFNNLFSKILVSESGYENFITKAKENIKKYYDSNCESVIRLAKSLRVQGKYDEAIYELSQVPDISKTCHENALSEIENIYQEKIDKECLVALRNAKSIWSSSPNAEGARLVSEIVNQISPFSSCDPDLSILLSDIKAKLTQDQKDAFELKIKKYNDAIELKREALRIDEEDRKRLAAIQKSALKAEYAQKKYEEESGGLLNSIKKLKVILWGEGSSKFLDKKREQYQKK